MAAHAPNHTDEKALLLGYLGQQRDGVRVAAFGLTEEQGRATPTAGALSIAGLVRHIGLTERHWMAMVTGELTAPEDPAELEAAAEAYDDGFTPGAGQTLESLLDDLAETAAATEAIVAELDLDHQVPVPKGVPWFPQDVESWSLRWVLLHLIEEEARHAGHADIVRESIDGATMYELKAAAEGWPATDWLTPWRPPAPPT